VQKKQGQARRLPHPENRRGVPHAPTLLLEAERIMATALKAPPRTYHTPPLVAFLLGALAAGFALCIAAPFI
jgi:hypothetical protein